MEVFRFSILLVGGKYDFRLQYINDIRHYISQFIRPWLQLQASVLDSDIPSFRNYFYA